MSDQYYDKEELRLSPSVRDGMDYSTEMMYRISGVKFIRKTGLIVGFSCEEVTTAVIIFHRFFMIHSFRSFSRYMVGCACLLIASKASHMASAIVQTAEDILTKDDFCYFGSNPKRRVKSFKKTIRETIDTNLKIELPYEYIDVYIKNFEIGYPKFREIAWDFVNDSLLTTLSLQHEPKIIAIATLYLARKVCYSQELYYSESSQLGCLESLDSNITVDLLEDISNQIIFAKVINDHSTPESGSHSTFTQYPAPSVEPAVNSSWNIFSKVRSVFSKIEHIETSVRHATFAYLQIANAVKHFQSAVKVWKLVRRKKNFDYKRIFYACTQMVRAFRFILTASSTIQKQFKSIIPACLRFAS